MDIMQNTGFNSVPQNIPTVIPNQNGFMGFGYNQPNQNPYVSQMRTPNVQNNQIPMLPGKIVESYEVFKSMDIPIDGNLYYFPKADRTEVYTKRWLQNGTTEQLTYKLVQENNEDNKINPMDEIMDKLNSIDERIEKFMNKPNTNNRNNNKKED